jgi:energy-coupling factor transport system ATP-binding protein
VRKIYLENVYSQYRRSKEPQLAGINLEIKEGELVLLAGPSGSGKSTLVLLLNGIIPHHTRANVTGTIDVFGKSPTEESVLEMANTIGMLLQDPESQLATSRVLDEIILTLEFQGKTSGEIDEIARNVMGDFEIEKLADNDSARMSGGEKQLVALAAMISRDPAIVILDEPTSNLDPVNTARVLKHVQRFKNEGRTVILIEHKINEVFNYCPPDKIILMDKGAVVQHGAPTEVFNSPIIEKIGLSIPTIARFIRKSGLQRKGSRYPWTLNEFRDYAGNFNIQELNTLKQVLGDLNRLDMDTGSQLLVFEDATFSYRSQKSPAMKGVSFIVNNGEFIAIIGNNGAGKSSLVKHIIGLNKPTTGAVTLEGVNTRKNTAAKLARKVAFLFQNPDNQIFASSVLNEVKYGPVNCGMDKVEALERAHEAIKSVKLDSYINQNPLKLSMGQKQRVAVASALAMAPEIIVLDEPTTGQDPTSLQGIMDLMRMEYEKQVTIVMVTHDMDLVDKAANRVIAMSENKVLADGKTDILFKDNDMLNRCNLMPPVRVQMLSVVESMMETRKT